MKNSKLIRSLEQLNSRDLRNFHDFVHSPFFNKHELTTQLFDYIYPNLGRKKALKKEIIYQHLFPNSTFESFRLSNLMSYLMDLLNAFFSQKNYQKKSQYWVDNLEAIYERNMPELLKINYRKAKKALKKQKVKDSHYFLTTAQIDISYDIFLRIGKKKKNSTLLKSAIFALDQFYFIEKIKHSCEIINWGESNNEQLDIKDISFFKKQIEENWTLYEKNILLKTYYHVLMIMLKDEEQTHYEYLVKTLKKDFSSYSKKEVTELYSFAINYAINCFNSGHEDFLEKVFALYQQAIADGVIYTNGQIHEGTYQNIINIACRLKEYKWARNFLENHREYLPPEYESNAYHFNLANILFNEKAFAEALDMLQDIQFTNQYYQNNTKLIQLKCYYELDMLLLLISFLDSYRVYLLRSRDIPTHVKDMCSKFIKAIQKLLKLQEEQQMLSKADFLKKIAKNQAEIASPNFLVINKDWLLAKIEVLKSTI